MLIYLIMFIALLYTVVAYYLCFTCEMPELPDLEEEDYN